MAKITIHAVKRLLANYTNIQMKHLLKYSLLSIIYFGNHIHLQRKYAKKLKT